MKMKSVIVLGIVLLFGTVAFAQDYAKVEVPMYYSFMRLNPENSNVVSGFSLNGGGGGVTVYVNHVSGFTGERQHVIDINRTEEHTSELQGPVLPAGRFLLAKKKPPTTTTMPLRGSP